MSSDVRPLRRVLSGVKGLDDILHGGFFGGGCISSKVHQESARRFSGIKFASIKQQPEARFSISR